MTAETDRADALKAAIQDIARDLEADLGKLSRFRGISDPTSPGMSFRDPGADIVAYEKQKADFPGPVRRTLDAYRLPLAKAHRVVGQNTSGATRSELLGLVASIQAITNLDDAAALVVTFEEN